MIQWRYCLQVTVIFLPCLILCINLDLGADLCKSSSLRDLSSSSRHFTLSSSNGFVLCFVMNNSFILFQVTFWRFLSLMNSLIELWPWDRSSEILSVILLPLISINISDRLENICWHRLSNFFEIFLLPDTRFSHFFDFFEERFEVKILLWMLKLSKRALSRAKGRLPLFGMPASLRLPRRDRRPTSWNPLWFDDFVRIVLVQVSKCSKVEFVILFIGFWSNLFRRYFLRSSILRNGFTLRRFLHRNSMIVRSSGYVNLGRNLLIRISFFDDSRSVWWNLTVNVLDRIVSFLNSASNDWFVRWSDSRKHIQTLVVFHHLRHMFLKLQVLGFLNRRGSWITCFLDWLLVIWRRFERNPLACRRVHLGHLMNLLSEVLEWCLQLLTEAGLGVEGVLFHTFLAALIEELSKD